ncbi:hypothetical protein O3P69_019362 [Scylla paramamosain]|uniref:Mucin-like domain-containing protein n=1 Tax=Scylla paramamosain TaxID=85552 RepID=A0AAW0SZJ7_SCYPA
MAGGYTLLGDTEEREKDKKANGKMVESETEPLRVPDDLTLTPELTCDPPGPPRDLISVFVVTFDPKEGNLLEWCVPKGVSLDGVEFRALISGAHTITSDFIYFQTRGLLRDSLLQEDGADVRVGERGEDEKCGCSSVSLQSATPAPAPPCQVRQGPNDGTRQGLEESPYHFIQALGEQLVCLWRASLLCKRILLFSEPPIGWKCHWVYLISLLGAHSTPGLPSALLRPLYYVSLADLDLLADQHAYVACTTEKIFEEKPAIYDLYIEAITTVTPEDRLRLSTLFSQPNLTQGDLLAFFRDLNDAIFAILYRASSVGGSGVIEKEDLAAVGLNRRDDCAFVRELAATHGFDVIRALLLGWCFVAGTLADYPPASYSPSPAQKPYKPAIEYAGPIVYSDEKPPIIHFPRPPLPKAGGYGGKGSGKSQPVKYVPLPHHELPVLIYQSDSSPPIHVVHTPAPAIKAPVKASYGPPPKAPSPSYGPPKAPTPSYRPPPKAPSPSYGPPPKAPSPSYGPPPKGPPKGSFGLPLKAPRPSYRPPPKAPRPSYGPPPKAPSPLYGPPPRPHPLAMAHPPKAPSPSYGPPPKAPAPTYGPPKPSSIAKGPIPKAPSPSYGPPPKAPSPSYGPPPKAPSPSYGPPPKAPSPSYGPPPKAPSPSYGPPPKAPSPSYGPPPKAPSPSYGPPPKAPSPSYRPPPKAPSPTYGPPKPHKAPSPQYGSSANTGPIYISAPPPPSPVLVPAPQPQYADSAAPKPSYGPPPKPKPSYRPPAPQKPPPKPPIAPPPKAPQPFIRSPTLKATPQKAPKSYAPPPKAPKAYVPPTQGPPSPDPLISSMPVTPPIHVYQQPPVYQVTKPAPPPPTKGLHVAPAAPKPSYGPPPKAKAPRPTLKAPRPSYGPPPKAPSPSYGPPPKAPSPSYGPPPKAPSPSYGPPPKAPSPSYGPPPKAPSPSYGPPPKAPSPSYGPPPKAPSPSYGPPPKAPSPSYGPPPKAPSPRPSYRPPPKAPSPSYGPPPKAPSPSYGPPPKAPSPSYGTAT